VGVATAPTAAPAGGRPESAVIWPLTTGCSRRRQREEPLERGARTLGTQNLFLTSDQLLEMSAAAATAVIVNRHEGAWPRGNLWSRGEAAKTLTDLP
jgi:hypothetical protein